MKSSSKLVQYLGFTAIGIISNIIGPLLPAIRSDISISYSQSGMLLSGQFMGMLLTAIIGGYLMDKWGKKPFLFAGSAMLIIGLVGSTAARSYIFLYSLNLITGFGYGIYEVGINALCADSSEENKGSDMSFVHFFFGVGAIIAPVLAMFSTEYLGNWRYSFGIPAVIPLLISILLATARFEAHVNNAAITFEGTDTVTHPYKNLFLWAAGLTAFFYVGLEVSTGGWIVTFWNSEASAGMLPASIIATIFWAALTIGRLFAGRIADRIGLSKYMVTAASGTLLLALLWSILPSGSTVIALVILLGFLLSGQFPTIMALATAHYPGKSGTTAAFITVFSALGGFILPAAIGRVADQLGIGVLPYSILALSVLLVIFAVTAQKRSSQ